MAGHLRRVRHTGTFNLAQAAPRWRPFTSERRGRIEEIEYALAA
ncbi:MAG TPA: hypothetical protein VNB06_07170 [Thermoanaerobaculia bacterium]|nr:hypothetical protein [Thermoanaerobaculia bacterium]